MHIEIRRSLKKDLTYKDAEREIFCDKDFLKELDLIISKKSLDEHSTKLMCSNYLKEIAARYTENKLFWNVIESIVRKKVIGSFKYVYYNKESVKKLKDFLQNSIVTIVPNHRSVFDFVILSYIIVKESTFMPIIPAADVFDTFPIGYIFRRGGAYFLRRNETNELYFLVFKCYVALILKYELVHMFFIEGGRNKTGGYSESKKGILKYLVNGFKKHDIKKDLIFLPVNISYDIVPESRVVIEESISGVRKHIFSSLINYIIKKNLGNCYVNFGRPIRMSDISLKSKTETELIDSLGNILINDIKSLVIVSPISLMSYTLLKSNKVKFPDFKKAFTANLRKLKKSKKNIDHIDTNNIPQYLQFADEKGIITYDTDKEIIKLTSKQKQLIQYYSNNILHLFQ